MTLYFLYGLKIYRIQRIFNHISTSFLNYFNKFVNNEIEQ